MSGTRIDIGVACSSGHHSDWTSALIGSLLSEERGGRVEIGEIFMISSALPDHNKNHVVSGPFTFAPENEKRRNDLTDANRLAVTRRYLDGKSEYLFFIDDDTIHPQGTISQLLSLKREMAAGVYYNAKHPYNAIAYMKREEDGLYYPVDGWSYGAIFQVDSVGMGCTLIHRSVFERIAEEHSVFVRPNGSLAPVHKSMIYQSGQSQTRQTGGQPYVLGNELHIPVSAWPGDSRPWPYFALEYGRTEDHHFCELAGAVGIRPWLDTSINCSHIKPRGVGRDEYKGRLFAETIADASAGTG